MTVTPNFTPEQKAYFDSKGAVDPTTGQAAVEEKEPDAPPPVIEAEAEAEPEKETPAPEPEEDDDGEPETVDVANAEGETRRKMIAFGAYDKQRVRAKKLEAEKAELAQQLAYMQGLVERTQAGRQPQAQGAPQGQPQAPSGPAPDYRKEPEKWLDWVQGGVQKAVEATTQHQQTTEQQRQFQDLNNAVTAAEQEFAAENPDFYDALKYAQTSRKAELKSLGYDPQEIQQIMAAQAQDIAIRSLRQGANPAQRIYEYAKARGYAKKAPPAAAPDPKKEAEKIARQAANQAAAKTLAGAAGGAEKTMTAETLAKMDTKEFLKLHKEGKVHEILGLPR